MTFFEPWAEELDLGIPLAPAPAITIDTGLAWQYQSICGDSLRVPLSNTLAKAVTSAATLANPGLVMQIVIGQSTVATRRVIANLFYRNVRLHQQVALGTTITTIVTPIASTLAKPHPSGDRAKVLLAIKAQDQEGNVVVDFERLALMPVRSRDKFASGGDLGTAIADLGFEVEEFLTVVPTGWVLDELPSGSLAPVGETREDPLSEPIEDALALVRLTQNLAGVHRDARRGKQNRRLVYGGHVVGLAQASLSRADPGIATILGWRACDHLSAVFEDDLLTSRVTLEGTQSLGNGTLAAYRVDTFAVRDSVEVPVLRWTPVVLTAGTPHSHTGGA